jgi:uncharacterized membrane protein
MTKARLEAFSDGVFGVAITLLILDVRAENGGTGWEMLSHAGFLLPFYQPADIRACAGVFHPA